MPKIKQVARLAYCRLRRIPPFENFQKEGNYIFIHIPKAAGTSVSSALGLKKSYHARWLDYAKYLGDKNIKEYFVFAFVRNPWARFLSLYNYSRMEVSHFHSNVPGVDSIYGPHLDYHTLKDASLLDCARLLKDGRLKHGKKLNQWHPQIVWLTDSKGEIQADFIGKVENIDEDFRLIATTIKCPASSLQHSNMSSHTDYREAFDDESAEIIGDYYKKDIETFGYKFL